MMCLAPHPNLFAFMAWIDFALSAEQNFQSPQEMLEFLGGAGMFSPTMCWCRWCRICPATERQVMGQILHRCARTTEAMHRAIQQHSQKSLNNGCVDAGKTAVQMRWVTDDPGGPGAAGGYKTARCTP